MSYDIFLYLVDMPDNTKEAVTPCSCGYTVYVNSKLTRENQQLAYDHAMRHIEQGDFDKSDIQAIEYSAHKCGE